jgi:uncharacterized protein YpuA (DUF1002 family)
MKTANVMLLVLMATTLTVAGCAGRHYGSGAQDREAALQRGVTETNDLLDRTVKDPARASQAKAIVQDIVGEVKQSYKVNQEYHKKLYALNTNYDAAPEQFTKLLDDLNNARMASATKILGMRFKMKSILTPQEWKEFAAAMDRARSRYMPKSDGM